MTTQQLHHQRAGKAPRSGGTLVVPRHVHHAVEIAQQQDLHVQAVNEVHEGSCKLLALRYQMMWGIHCHRQQP